MCREVVAKGTNMVMMMINAKVMGGSLKTTNFPTFLGHQ
jgi:hypothetical protein